MVCLIITHHYYCTINRHLPVTGIFEELNFDTIVKDRLAGSPSGSAKAAAVTATVEQVSMPEEVVTREEPAEEPVVEKPPSQDLQAFDPIRKHPK